MATNPYLSPDPVDEPRLRPLADGWTITSTTLTDLFHEVEQLVWRQLLEPDLFVILAIEDQHRFVQFTTDDEDGGVWCETVSDYFFDYPDGPPHYTEAELASLVRNRWGLPSGTFANPCNWHRHFPLDTPGLPALVSQLLVSTLIDTHHLTHPSQLTVEVGHP